MGYPEEMERGKILAFIKNEGFTTGSNHYNYFKMSKECAFYYKKVSDSKYLVFINTGCKNKTNRQNFDLFKAIVTGTDDFFKNSNLKFTEIRLGFDITRDIALYKDEANC